MSRSVDFESIVRHYDPTYDDIHAGGFKDYVFGGRIGKIHVHEPWSDPETSTETILDIDWVEQSWPGNREDCYVDSNGYLKPDSICGGPPTAFCPDIVPEFTYTSLVIDAGAIITGPVENEINVDGEYTQVWRWHTVQPNLDGLEWKALLEGQIITARYVQYKIHVSTK